MRLKEFQGKELFRQMDIPIPKHVLIKELPDIKKVHFDECVVKAQVASGKRGKRGLVQIVPRTRLSRVIKDFFSQGISEILVEEKVHIDKELYLSLMINRSHKCITLIYSDMGGMDVEEASRLHGERFLTVDLFDINAKRLLVELNVEHAKQVIDIAKRLYTIMKHRDATLVEINPLVVSGNKLVAVDSKVVVDDNALAKYPRLSMIHEKSFTRVERDARKYHLQYVELKGNIAVVGNGAGLVMSTLDVLDHFGGKAANFLDVGGGATVEKMSCALDIVLEKKSVMGVFINIFGGITRCDDIARGIVEYRAHHKVALPIVVRMIGTNEKEGKRILEENGIHALDSMEDGAKKIVQLVTRKKTSGKKKAEKKDDKRKSSQKKSMYGKRGVKSDGKRKRSMKRSNKGKNGRKKPGKKKTMKKVSPRSGGRT